MIKKSHLLVQILPLLLVFEVGDELLDSLHQLSLGEVLLGKQPFQLLEESVHLWHGPAGSLFHHTQSHEAVHVDALARDIELFVSLPSTSSG